MLIGGRRGEEAMVSYGCLFTLRCINIVRSSIDRLDVAFTLQVLGFDLGGIYLANGGLAIG